MAGGVKSFLAFWLGHTGASPFTPPTTTDIRAGQLTISAGLLSLRNDSGSESLRTNNGTVELVITS